MTNLKTLLAVTLIFIAVGLFFSLHGEVVILTPYNNMENEAETGRVDLDIDSDNDAWVSWIPTAAEELIEDNSAKIIITNEGCESGDEKPDYANLNARPGETNLVPMRLSLNTVMSLSSFKIKIEYDGENELNFNSTPTVIPDSDIVNIPFTTGKTYIDYTVLKQDKFLRIWAGLPTYTGYTAARKANKFGTKSNPALTDPDGNYLAPNNEYSAELLFTGQSGPNYTATLWVEGIKPSASIQIKTTLFYQQPSDMTWEDVFDDAVKVRVVEGNLTVNVNNDKDFNLEDKDDKLEDQNDGFICWEDDDWTTIVGTNDSNGLENLFPAKVKIPRDLYDSGWKFYIRLTGNTLTVYENVNANVGTGDRMAHFKNANNANTQIGAEWFWVSSTKDDITLPTGKDIMEYLFQVNGEGVFTMEILAKSPNCSQLVNIDTCKITAKDLDKMFMYGSVRGSTSISCTYPVDGGDTVSIDKYPDFQLDNNFSARDISKNKYFIFIHGYNVDTGDAVDTNRSLFRRMYWTGFRGNYVGLTWHGDEGQIDLVDITPAFWSNNYNAMQTAYPVMRFLKNTLQNSWGANSSNITVMGHSLGNLVMWDALRLYAKYYPGTTAVKNVISVEAAVWEEAFNVQNQLIYAGETPASNNITYSVNELITHSWAFWFMQPGRTAKSVVSNHINSYFVTDEALLIMKNSDFILKDGGLFGDNHYERGDVAAILPSNRTPEKLANNIPALLQIGHRNTNYAQADLNNPLGMVLNTFFNNNIDGGTLGWDGHSSLITRKYYDMYDWYDNIWAIIK